MTANYPQENAPSNSGRAADPERVVGLINDKLASLGVDAPADVFDKSTAYDWNDKVHRKEVRRLFEGNDGENYKPGDDEPMLPGFGPDGDGGDAREDCGDPHPWVCTGCAKATTLGRTCGMSVCGRCGKTWVRDAAVPKAAKLRRVRIKRSQQLPEGTGALRHHTVISPPLEWWEALADAGLTLAEAYEATGDLVKEIADELRAPGLLVRHSFRGRDDDGNLRVDGGDNMGFWKDVLFDDYPWYGPTGARRFLAWQPHYHLICLSDHFPMDGFTPLVQEATGWVLHRIVDDENVSIGDDRDMAAVTVYALSHGDIIIRDGRNNRSENDYIGYVDGEHLANSHSPHPADTAFADEWVRDSAREMLGLTLTSTDCGETIPSDMTPDKLAREIIADVWPDHGGAPTQAEKDAILGHVVAGNISTTTTSDGGVSASLSGSAGTLSLGNAASPSEVSRPGTRIIHDPNDPDELRCSCERHSEDGEDDGEECSGQLIPLGEARDRGLLDDEEWLASATFGHEARAAHEDWADDLPRWRSSYDGGTTATAPG